MSQRSDSNTSESKLPSLHSLNNCWCVMDCGLTVGGPSVMCLCLGAAPWNVERGISVNSRMLKAERNKLSEETRNGLRNTKDMVISSLTHNHTGQKESLLLRSY